MIELPGRKRLRLCARDFPHGASRYAELANDGPDPFWRKFKSAITTAVILAVARRFGENPDGLEIFHGALTVRQHDGTSLTAHLDALSAVMQLILYLPDDDGNAHLGTRLYRELEPPDPPVEYSVTPQLAHDVGAKLELAKTIPFKRNTLFSSKITIKSWHGFAYAGDGPYRRKSYQCFVRRRAS